jgi:hypothetical protein
LVAVNAIMILIAAMLLSAAAEFAVAQDIVGRIVGTVTDPSGAAVPDIKVTIVNEATQAGRDVTSDPPWLLCRGSTASWHIYGLGTEGRF